MFCCPDIKDREALYTYTVPSSVIKSNPLLVFVLASDELELSCLSKHSVSAWVRLPPNMQYMLHVHSMYMYMYMYVVRYMWEMYVYVCIQCSIFPGSSVESIITFPLLQFHFSTVHGYSYNYFQIICLITYVIQNHTCVQQQGNEKH